ncbi:ASCH domain-containing protein [Planococcus soli]|uniref:ASCH domain-containing protein n=1 Tax=Planococcus soli TaxID=2666072 RepID=UPI00115E1412|nr:ASCH domain-containing protein [Planococcus soli]
MNEITEFFWNDYWMQQSQKPLDEYDAFQFGADADRLAELVATGMKTATCSAHILYELEGEAVPQIHQYSVVLDAKNLPVAIIQVTSVALVPMNKVPEEFALAEGEGDYAYWWDAHKLFFTQELAVHGLSYSDNLLLVCERFKVVHKV